MLAAQNSSGAHDEKLDLLSFGIKYRTQSKVKLALSALLSPREEVIWLFCCSICASYHCHTSNYKLIRLKMQKGCTSFSSRFCTGKQLPFLVSLKSIFLFSAASPQDSYQIQTDCWMYVWIWFLSAPDFTCATSARIINCEIQPEC